MDAALRRPLRLNWLSFGRPTFVRAQLGAKPILAGLTDKKGALVLVDNGGGRD
jgi:hypothetical protein